MKLGIMNSELKIRKSILISAPISKVWSALTDPDLVKQYLVGAEVISDWKVGSKIVYCGSFNGVDFKDEGEITQLEPGGKFQYTYWSANHGTENIKENHVVLTYSLSKTENRTLLIVEQENYQSKELAAAMIHVWDHILGNLKELLEKKSLTIYSPKKKMSENLTGYCPIICSGLF
jgi:uncharacterized protein YndB with AHSA1/START domain